MRADELFLAVQRLVDRLIRRLRLGPAPPAGRRRLLVVQIDGLSRAVFELALASGRVPFLEHLLVRHGYAVSPMAVGLPTSTPAFQMAAMYGVEPDIPGFHYHDKRRRTDIYFPRGRDAAIVEEAQSRGRPGIVAGGSTYGCVFTGGAANSLFSFAMIGRPTGSGLMRAVSAFVVLGWASLKSLSLTALELIRAVLRFVADPVTETCRGWKWLTIKIGISVWLRQLFTLAVSRDLYQGVPVIYVNYLDYDVFGHVFGPRHRRALRALRGVDRSIHQLWRIVRRVPEHGYDLYILSDHGMALCRPYRTLNEGQPLEQRLFEEHLGRSPREAASVRAPSGRRLASGLEAYRRARAPGLFQRFVNHLEKDFPWILGERREAREQDGIRVIAAGPNAFVYFLDSEAPVAVERIDERFPGLVDGISRSRGIGFVLVRSARGPLCVWRGKRHHLDELRTEGPFVGRDDLPLVRSGIESLMAMESAGDLVIYGNDAVEGHVSYVSEVGAHAGPAPEELHTLIVSPPGVALPLPITHPIQLYRHFIRYQSSVPDVA